MTIVVNGETVGRRLEVCPSNVMVTVLNTVVQKVLYTVDAGIHFGVTVMKMVEVVIDPQDNSEAVELIRPISTNTYDDGKRK
jgi:hypothetical protein